jgi:alpha-D-ribose 1-methylphosphonate 5-triphosphate synthase subunit PhnH
MMAMTVPQSCAASPGFADPVSDANAVFRTVLRAMSLPGRILSLPLALESPRPLGSAAAAILLTLVDQDTPVWLDPPCWSEAVGRWLRFHCGCPIAARPERAAFAVTGQGLGLSRFFPGTLENPETAATVIVEVDDFGRGDRLLLSGPGIDKNVTLSVAGMASDFWREIGENHHLFPQGVDVVLTAGHRLACLPRSTVIEEVVPCMSR